MSDKDSWYLSSDWLEKDQEVFFDKIKRARGNSSKSQYIKIKALSLMETLDARKIDAAIELLKYALREYPSEFDSDTDAANEALGGAYRLKNDYRTSAAYYELALTWSNSRGPAYWEYPEMIVTHELTDLYERAYAIVNRNIEDDELILQYHIFVYHGVRSIVFGYQKKLEEAKFEAGLALQATEITRSVFTHHPKIGLVNKDRHPLISKLEIIINK